MLISIATLFCLMPRVAMELPPRTAAAPVASQFERKEYNVTDWCCQALCCVCCPITFGPLIPGVMGSKTIVLEPEEAVYHVSCPCCKINTRRPYGELGSVDAVSCCCCVGVGSELTNKMAVFPGSGCNRPLVDEIVAVGKEFGLANGYETGYVILLIYKIIKIYKILTITSIIKTKMY